MNATLETTTTTPMTTTPTPPATSLPGPRALAAARVRSEGPVGLDVACKWFPAKTDTGHASPGTLLRWIVNGKSGVTLDAARVKGHWHTSAEAVARFLQATGEAKKAREERGGRRRW
jgi:Protein of unknown function (DUF1580)